MKPLQSVKCMQEFYLKDNSRECGLIVTILVSLRLGFFLPVLFVCFKGLSKPTCYIRLQTERITEENQP